MAIVQSVVGVAPGEFSPGAANRKKPENRFAVRATLEIGQAGKSSQRHFSKRARSYVGGLRILFSQMGAGPSLSQPVTVSERMGKI